MLSGPSGWKGGWEWGEVSNRGQDGGEDLQGKRRTPRVVRGQLAPRGPDAAGGPCGPEEVAGRVGDVFWGLVGLWGP